MKVVGFEREYRYVVPYLVPKWLVLDFQFFVKNKSYPQCPVSDNSVRWRTGIKNRSRPHSANDSGLFRHYRHSSLGVIQVSDTAFNDEMTIMTNDDNDTPHFPWQFLYFFPLPQGQGSLRPTTFSFIIGCIRCGGPL